MSQLSANQLAELEHLNAQQLRRLLVEHLTQKKLGLYWEANAIERDAAICANLVLPRLSAADSQNAARKARHIPAFYGKVLFLTKDEARLKWVKDDGRLGKDVDLNDLDKIRVWLRDSKPKGIAL